MADPDTGGGGGHLDPEIRGSPGLKKFFSALQASVWSNSRGLAPRAHPLDLPLYATIYTEQLFVSARKAVRYHSFTTTFTASKKREIPIDDFLN